MNNPNRGIPLPRNPPLAIQRPPPIVVHNHDVLSGRGVNIAHHPGNERFRTLVTTRADDSYCTRYSASEKRAMAEEIIKHIHSLNPPGRFLRKDYARTPTSAKGLNGFWIELSHREAVKKTCQALRDCNRMDRQGYASGVIMPEDVLREANQRAQELAGKAQAVVTQHHSSQQPPYEPLQEQESSSPPAAAAAAHPSQPSLLKRPMNQTDWGRVSPSVENAAEWLKRQRTDNDMAATAAAAAAAVSSDLTDETAVAAANAVNDLLTCTTAEEADVAEAAEVVASITADDLGRSSTSTSQYELSTSEEALAREMAEAASGLYSAMNGGGGGLATTTAEVGGEQATLQQGGQQHEAAATLQHHESGTGLNMHNMNEL